MKNGTIITPVIVVVLVSCAGWFTYSTLSKRHQKIFFKTQKAEKRDLYKIVNAEGSLEAQGTSKIGSLISAKVKEIYVKEGQKITKDTLLAALENDKGGDADVRQTEALCKKAQATLTFAKADFARQEALFKSGQLSKQAYDKATQDYTIAQADVQATTAAYEKELFLFQQTQVKAPHAGIIVSIPTKVGQAFSPFTSPPQILFEIAENLETMKATLYIDENKIGDIKLGMKANITVDAYPHQKPWKGEISSLGLGRAFVASLQTQQGISYEAIVLLDNTQGLLRPGMTVHAKITIAKAKQVLAVPGFVFQLNSKVLQEAANVMGYDFKPVDQTKKKTFAKQQKHPIKTLWTIENKTFVEKIVTLGITDNAYFQILSGITETDDIIADDMTSSDELKKIAKQIAGGA